MGPQEDIRFGHEVLSSGIYSIQCSQIQLKVIPCRGRANLTQC